MSVTHFSLCGLQCAFWLFHKDYAISCTYLAPTLTCDSCSNNKGLWKVIRQVPTLGKIGYFSLLDSPYLVPPLSE